MRRARDLACQSSENRVVDEKGGEQGASRGGRGVGRRLGGTTDDDVPTDAIPTEPRRRRGPLLAACVFVAVVAGVVAAAVVAGGSGERGEIAVGAGEPAPPFELPDLADPTRTVRLADFRGRPLILNFWASWCVPCRKEMPLFEALHRRAGDRLAVVGVDRLDQRDDALAFLREVGATYPSVYDRDATLDAPYRLVGMPTTVFVSPDGTVLERLTGELPEERLEQAVRRHFPGVLDGS